MTLEAPTSAAMNERARTKTADRTERPSGESSTPIIGCVGCLIVVGIVVVDYFPYLGVLTALAHGRHPLWASSLIVVLGLAAGPIAAGLVGYSALRWRDRVVAAFEGRWPGLTSLDNAAALNLEEATFLIALAFGLGTGALLGTAVVRALDGVLP
jgi:hypothetical protein